MKASQPSEPSTTVLWPIVALASGAFALGMSEFAPNGILPLVAADYNISTAFAGWVSTAFAVGGMVGGPVIALCASRVSERKLIQTLLTLFTLVTVASVTAGNFGTLIASRVITGAILGAYLGASITLTSRLVPARRRTGAIAMIFSGMTVSNVVGVPVGNYVAQIHGWRSAFALVGVFTVVSLVMCLGMLPRTTAAPSRTAYRVTDLLRRPRIWLTLAVVILGYGGLFVVFTYITPFLINETGLALEAVPWVLLVFGIGVVVGNVAGGYFGNRFLRLTVLVSLTVMISSLFLLAGLGSRPGAVIPLVVLLGLAGFGLIPSLQAVLVFEAGQASVVASALGSASFNAGIALGSGLGGFLIDVGPVRWLPLAGAFTSAAGLLLFVILRKLPTTDQLSR